MYYVSYLTFPFLILDFEIFYFISIFRTKIAIEIIHLFICHVKMILQFLVLLILSIQTISIDIRNGTIQCFIDELCQQTTDKLFTIPIKNETYYFETLDSQDSSIGGKLCVMIQSTVFKSNFLCQFYTGTPFMRFVFPYSIVPGKYKIISQMSNPESGIYTITSEDVFATVVDQIPNILNNVYVFEPKYGSIQENQEFHLQGLTRNLVLGSYSHAVFDITGVYQNIIQVPFESIDISQIEPSSWFYTITPMASVDIQLNDIVMSRDGILLPNNEEYHSTLFGFPTKGYVEFVLSPEDIQKQRMFRNHHLKLSQNSLTLDPNQFVTTNTLNPHWKQSIRQYFANQYPNRAKKMRSQPINICILSGLQMDGQKKIWLDQFSNLSPSEFRFTLILSDPTGSNLNPDKQSIFSHLSSSSNVKVVYQSNAQLTISEDNLSIKPSDGGPSAEEFWQNNMTRLFIYMHQRFESANGQVDLISPDWVRVYYQTNIDFYSPLQCDMFVYGNSRGYSSDVFIVDFAKVLQIPTMTELLNLYLEEDLLPDIIIAPSLHSLQHESIQYPIHQKLLHRGSTSFGIVISPSVELKHFNSVKFSQALPNVSIKPQSRAKSCNITSPEEKTVLNKFRTFLHWPCIMIGFVGRVTAEKNPGLFVQAAYFILQAHPMARFRFIGSGAISRELEQLTIQLGIDYAFDFIGWIPSDQLPLFLDDIDIIINPSLRGWSETFCIANIEAMAMQIPLVTFAVGGIGEYVYKPKPSDSSRIWSISDNAMIVNKADPKALAEAVYWLLTHPLEARNIGERARQSLIPQFLVNRQMSQYKELYQSVFDLFYS